MWNNFGVAIHDKFITCFKVENKFQNYVFFPIKQNPPTHIPHQLIHSLILSEICSSVPCRNTELYLWPEWSLLPYASACWVSRWDFLEASGWLTMCWADGLYQGNKSEGFGTQQISCACSWCSPYPPPGIPWWHGNPCSFAASWFLLMFRCVLWSVPGCGIP